MDLELFSSYPTYFIILFLFIYPDSMVTHLNYSILNSYCGMRACSIPGEGEILAV